MNGLNQGEWRSRPPDRYRTPDEPGDGQALKRRILGKWRSMPAELIARQSYSRSPDRSASVRGRAFLIIFSLGNRWHTPHLLDRRSVCAEFDIENGIFSVQLP
jgi:hypothetical protein